MKTNIKENENAKESAIIDDKEKECTAQIFNIQRFSIQDGPGLRTTVFFKGCPLSCLWCANPESQAASPQLLYIEAHCVKCYRCIDVCPDGVNKKNQDGSLRIDRNKCKACGKCSDIEVCPNEARSICGKQMTVEELMLEVKKDSLFYRNSGGGITASGGEPTQQADFLMKFFKRCHDCNFHTTLDTCGYVKWEKLERILEHTDLVLYDLKHMDPVRHKELTGVGNRLILDNIRRIAKRGTDFIVRAPIIPGCNDSIENLQAMAKFVTELGREKINLLPYHTLGVDKCVRLGGNDKLEGSKPFKREEVQLQARVFESYGLEVEIV